MSIYHHGYNVYTYGIDNKSDYMASSVALEEFASKYTIEMGENKYQVNVPVGGIHFVYNSLAAIAVGKCLNMQMEEILSGINEFELTKMRMDITKHKNNVTLVNDTYNASMESMKAALEYLARLNGTKKLAVLGDMLELGEFSEIMHREVGACVARCNVDMLVTIGDMAQYIADEAKTQGMKAENVMQFKDNASAIEYIEKNIELKDVAILVKASRGMKLEVVANKIKESI